MSSCKIRQKHWESTFKKVDYTQVLWHQSSPAKSIELIQEYSAQNAEIIDAGCGASLLVDELLSNGYKNITLLDTSKTSLNIVKNRIKTQNINFICNDILNLEATNKFDIWHDRAVFHFLLTKSERERYFEVLYNALKPNAIAIISTFRDGAPTQCAGLDIVQYTEEKILNELPKNLKLIRSEEYTHVTYKESEQKYIYFIIRKV